MAKIQKIKNLFIKYPFALGFFLLLFFIIFDIFKSHKNYEEIKKQMNKTGEEVSKKIEELEICKENLKACEARYKKEIAQ